VLLKFLADCERAFLTTQLAFKKPPLEMARLIPPLSGLGGIIYLMLVYEELF